MDILNNLHLLLDILAGSLGIVGALLSIYHTSKQLRAYKQPPSGAQQAYQQSEVQKTNKGRFVLFFSVAIVAFFLIDTAANTTRANTPTPTATPIPTSLPALNDTQLGQQIIQQYYDALNQRNCQDAYKLWNRSSGSVKQFCDGFQNMIHDDVSFGNVTKLSDGTVKVPVTLTVLEKDQQGGVQRNIYTGYYIVGKQDDNSWKIIYGELH